MHASRKSACSSSSLQSLLICKSKDHVCALHTSMCTWVFREVFEVNKEKMEEGVSEDVRRGGEESYD